MTDSQAFLQLIGAVSQIGLGFVFLVQWYMERQERIRVTNILIEREKDKPDQPES